MNWFKRIQFDKSPANNELRQLIEYLSKSVLVTNYNDGLADQIEASSGGFSEQFYFTVYALIYIYVKQMYPVLFFNSGKYRNTTTYLRNSQYTG